VESLFLKDIALFNALASPSHFYVSKSCPHPNQQQTPTTNNNKQQQQYQQQQQHFGPFFSTIF
jgi:hypothetical protein